MGTIRISTREPVWHFADLLADLKPFKTHGALEGQSACDPCGYLSSDTGRMPEPHRSEYKDAHWQGSIDYVVYSYGTPIAWHTTYDGWHMPQESYSKTTTVHQSKIRKALQYRGAL